MAQRVHITIVDDIDESPADEKVLFALDGVSYEIDLSAANAATFREVLAPYVGVARPVSARRGRGKQASAPAASATEIRAWAAANGFEVSGRGRIPSQVKQAYDLAHG